MAQRLRLVAFDQRFEEAAFLCDTLGKGQGGGGLHRGDACLRRILPLDPPRIGGAIGVEEAGRRLGQLVGPRARHGMVVANDGARKGDGFLVERGVIDQPVDKADLLRLRGGDGRAGHDHRQRFGDADDARQTLRAARPGEQAKLHFGQAQLGRSRGDAVMAAKRDLQPTAERGAMDRGDHRLAALFDGVDDGGEAGFHRRLAEFGDVRPGEEGAPGRADDDGANGVIGRCLRHRIGQAGAHLRRQGVHGRIVRRDDQNVAVALRADHAHHLSPYASIVLPVATAGRPTLNVHTISSEIRSQIKMFLIFRVEERGNSA